MKQGFICPWRKWICRLSKSQAVDHFHTPFSVLWSFQLDSHTLFNGCEWPREFCLFVSMGDNSVFPRWRKNKGTHDMGGRYFRQSQGLCCGDKPRTSCQLSLSLSEKENDRGCNSWALSRRIDVIDKESGIYILSSLSNVTSAAGFHAAHFVWEISFSWAILGE